MTQEIEDLRASDALQPGHYRAPSFIELIRGYLSPPVFRPFDNRVFAEGFREGRGFLIGDIVRARRFGLFPYVAEVVSLHNADPVGRAAQKFRNHAWLALVRRGDRLSYVPPSQIYLVDRQATWRKFFHAVEFNEDTRNWREADILEDPLLKLRDSSGSYWAVLNDLITGVRLSGLMPDDDMGERHLRRAVLRADFGLEHDHDRSLINKAETRIARAIAAAMLGEPLNRDQLLRASTELEEHCATISSGYWGSMGQAYYLMSVLTSMLAEDWDRAAKLLKTRRSFRWLPDAFKALKSILRSRKSGVVAEDALAADCMDLLRHPFLHYNREDYQFDFLALLFAAVLEGARDDKKDWSRVIARLVA